MTGTADHPVGCAGAQAEHTLNSPRSFTGDRSGEGPPTRCRNHPSPKTHRYCTSGHCASGQLSLTWFLSLDGWVPTPKRGTSKPPTASVSQTGAVPFDNRAGRLGQSRSSSKARRDTRGEPRARDTMRTPISVSPVISIGYIEPHTPTEGRCARHERGVGCGGRGGVRRAIASRTNDAEAYGEVVWF
jgi:hypothetical protein